MQASTLHYYTLLPHRRSTFSCQGRSTRCRTSPGSTPTPAAPRTPRCARFQQLGRSSSPCPAPSLGSAGAVAAVATPAVAAVAIKPAVAVARQPLAGRTVQGLGAVSRRRDRGKSRGRGRGVLSRCTGGGWCGMARARAGARRCARSPWGRCVLCCAVMCAVLC